MNQIQKLNENQMKLVVEILKIKAENEKRLQKIEENIRGLIALIPHDQLDAFELGKGDGVYEKKVEKMLQPELNLKQNENNQNASDNQFNSEQGRPLNWI